MYNIKLEDYIPEPKPAKSDMIVAAHYYAAWKKGAAGLHDGFDDLHDFPERTPLMGYYDEENPKVCDWEIKWASEHGINCFIYCWYRKPEFVGKPVTYEALRCGHGLHEAMFNAKFCKYMNFAIMLENLPRWGNTDEKDLLENLLPFWTENYFKRENYLKIDNKPVLFVFFPQRLRNSFDSPEHQKRVFDSCREYMKTQGFDGMIFSYCTTMYRYENVDMRRVHQENLACGYDFCFGYSNRYDPPCDHPDQQSIIEGQLGAYEKELEIDPLSFTPTVTCFRDSTPRFSQKWIDQGYHFYKEKRWYATPESFREIIKRTKELTDKLPDGAWGKKFIAIDNWNEWDEGHYVSPSHEFGFKYLQAIREELTERDNLPDYRTPQEIGLSDFNKSRGEPDLSEICEKKFNLKKMR